MTFCYRRMELERCFIKTFIALRGKTLRETIKYLQFEKNIRSLIKLFYALTQDICTEVKLTLKAFVLNMMQFTQIA